jgi:1-acyl-sn-glycerol-3-phosphate acyltransferase
MTAEPLPPVVGGIRFTRTTVVIRGVLAFVIRRIARLDISGAENIPARGPALLVFNQLSILDTPLITMLGNRRDITGLVARDYRRNLVYRFLIGEGGAIWIRRNASDHTALKSALDALANGWVLGISPEGRRSRTGGLMKGNPGPAFLGKHSGVPVVPVAITDTHRVGASLLRARRARVTVRIGPPFRLAPFDHRGRREQLREDTELIMSRIAGLLPDRYRGEYADVRPQTLAGVR